MNNMTRVLSAAVMAGMALTTFAGGLQTRDRCGAFDVKAVTGEYQGKQLCYV
jgi:hypothetical protein